MDLGLSGKTALITGGTSGIGLAIARRLGEEGCRIAICGRDRGKLDAAIAKLQPIEAAGFVADVCEPDDVARLIEGAVKALGGIDIVVSNAGTHIAGSLADISGDRLLGHFRTKVLGPWELARRVAP